MKPLAVTIPEFCRLVGCKRTTAFALISRREVVKVKLLGKTLVTLASIEALIERNSVPVKDAAI